MITRNEKEAPLSLTSHSLQSEVQAIVRRVGYWSVIECVIEERWVGKERKE